MFVLITSIILFCLFCFCLSSLVRRAVWASLWPYSLTFNMWSCMKTPSCSTKPEVTFRTSSCPLLPTRNWRRSKKQIQVLNQAIYSYRNFIQMSQKVVKSVFAFAECKLGKEDFVVLELLRWFKQDFFSWVDCLPCSHCGGQTHNAGSLSPSTDDLRWGAQRVENHFCQKCQLSTRFPRFVWCWSANDVKILSTFEINS